MYKKFFKLYSPPHKVKPSLYVAFGATCIILFGLAGSPVSMPINVYGAYILATIFGFLIAHTLVGMAAAVALTLFCTLKFRVVHPPAGGIPILIYYTKPSQPDFIFTVIAGITILLAMAEIYKKVTNERS
jgi:CBS-domain-containing membrane protein